MRLPEPVVGASPVRRRAESSRARALPAVLLSALAWISLASPAWVSLATLAQAAQHGRTAGANLATTSPVAAHEARLASGVALGAGSLRLLRQSLWVGPGQGRFEMDLAVTAPDPSAETLEVVVYPELITRSEFQFVLAGNFPQPYYQTEPVPLGKLVPGPVGGVEVDIPVNSPSGGLSIGSTGVYPVQVLLQRQGLTQGKPLTTFLVYVAPGATSFKRLEVAVVVPLVTAAQVSPSGAIGQVPPAAASFIEEEAGELADLRAPVSLEAPAWTVAAMARGPSQARQAVSELASAVRNGDELLPSTWLPVDIGSLVVSGLGSYVSEQLSAGSDALASLLGSAPSMKTWVLSGQVSPVSLGALLAAGARQFVLPETALSPLPSVFQRLTFAQPARLEVGGSGPSQGRAEQVLVMGADAELSQRVSAAMAPGQAVLVGYQILAELAMIDLEAPSDQRGVVLLPGPGTDVNPQFLSLLMSGLEGNPLLSAVTLSREFASVPLAREGGRILDRRLSGVAEPRPLAEAPRLLAAQRAVTEVGTVYGPGSAFVRGLSRELLISATSVFSSRLRARLVQAVDRSAERELHEVRLPLQGSITLTSRQARLPLTLLSSSRLSAHVRLVLSSEELSFVDARFPAGSCVASNPGGETCSLVLSRASTTLQVPVLVRTPGAFQLAWEVETPDGSVLARGSETIRSTAVSGVGLLLMVAAALFLAVWWARNARHGRRARRLVSSRGEGTGAWEQP
jgi:hypothetical protein